MEKQTLLTASFCVLVTTSHIAQADIGLGANIKTSEYKGADGLVNLHLEYQGEKLNINEESIAYTVKETDKLRFEVLGKTESRGYEEDISDDLKGMGDRDPSLDLGGRVTGKTKFGELSFATTTDITDRHNGHEADLRFGANPYQKHWNGKRELKVGTLAGVKWQSDDVVDYYYGVKSTEATADRAEYKGKAALTPYLGVQADVAFTEQLSLKAQAIYKKLPDEITDSPIVDANDVELKVGMTYWF